MSVHNIKREAMQSGDVYIGRAGHGFDGYFGNPFSSKLDGISVLESVERFAEYAKDRMYRDPTFRARIASLSGKRLFCFCKPGLCHGDVLEELAAIEHARLVMGVCNACGQTVTYLDRSGYCRNCASD